MSKAACGPGEEVHAFLGKRPQRGFPNPRTKPAKRRRAAFLRQRASLARPILNGLSVSTTAPAGIGRIKGSPCPFIFRRR